MDKATQYWNSFLLALFGDYKTRLISLIFKHTSNREYSNVIRFAMGAHLGQSRSVHRCAARHYLYLVFHSAGCDYNNRDQGGVRTVRGGAFWGRPAAAEHAGWEFPQFPALGLQVTASNRRRYGKCEDDEENRQVEHHAHAPSRHFRPQCHLGLQLRILSSFVLHRPGAHGFVQPYGVT